MPRVRPLKLKPYAVLFVSNSGAAPIVFAEAIMNRLGHGNFVARSASRMGRPAIEPFAFEVLRRYNYRTVGLSHRSMMAYGRPKAPTVDFVFDLNPNDSPTAVEVWPGHPIVARWAISDPATISGDDSAKRKAYADCYGTLYSRISVFVTLPLRSLTRHSIRGWIEAIEAGREPDLSATDYGTPSAV